MTDLIKTLEAQKAAFEAEKQKHTEAIFTLKCQIKSIDKAIAALVPQEKKEPGK